MRHCSIRLKLVMRCYMSGHLQWPVDKECAKPTRVELIPIGAVVRNFLFACF